MVSIEQKALTLNALYLSISKSSIIDDLSNIHILIAQANYSLQHNSSDNT